MFVPYSNFKEDKVRKVDRFYKRVLAKMVEESPEEIGLEIRMGQDSGVTEERSTPHTCNSEGSLGCMADPFLDRVEPQKEQERQMGG